VDKKRINGKNVWPMRRSGKRGCWPPPPPKTAETDTSIQKYFASCSSSSSSRFVSGRGTDPSRRKLRMVPKYLPHRSAYVMGYLHCPTDISDNCVVRHLKVLYDIWKCHTTSESVIRHLKVSYNIWKCHTTSENVIQHLKVSYDIWKCHTTSESVVQHLKVSYDIWKCCTTHFSQINPIFCWRIQSVELCK
jgi:hypothetical protein